MAYHLGQETGNSLQNIPVATTPGSITSPPPSTKVGDVESK